MSRAGQIIEQAMGLNQDAVMKQGLFASPEQEQDVKLAGEAPKEIDYDVDEAWSWLREDE